MPGYILNWFEVPVSDFARAKKFYEEILEITMDTDNMEGYRMAYFPCHEGKPTGCLTKGYGCIPDTTGTLIYLNGDPDLSAILDRIEQAGGKILVPKTAIAPEYGFFAHFEDTEGNKVGLHSAN